MIRLLVLDRYEQRLFKKRKFKKREKVVFF